MSDQRTDQIVRSVFEAFDEFRKLTNSITNGKVLQDRRMTIFILKLDREILDAYSSWEKAEQAAIEIMKARGGRWQQSRPGRWWATEGRLDICPRELK